MKQIKSSHIDLQLTHSVQTSNTSSATPSTGTSRPVNYNVNIKGNGDLALPDQEQLHITVNQSTNVAEIVQGAKVYVQNAQGQWYVLNKSDFNGVVNNPFSGVNIDQNSLLALVQDSKITDHGDENLNGQNLRHITADLDKNALHQLLTNNPQLKSTLGQQDLDTILNDTKSFQSSIDVWIDESQFYLHRTQLKLNILADTSGVGNGAPSTIATNLNTIVDLSKFNDPVIITPPTNATPTTNPSAILGFGKP